MIPYVVGQWVRGAQFYGRDGIISSLVEGPSSLRWLVGTRRIGKTSVLKQLELLFGGDEEELVPVFLDLQGVQSSAELCFNLLDGIVEAEQRLHRLGITLAKVTSDDFTEMFDRLCRGVARQGRRVLVLLDEAEELVQLHRDDPGCCQELLVALQRSPEVLAVMAASPGLSRLTDLPELSEHRCVLAEPLYLGPLLSNEARSLVLQLQLCEEQRPRLEDGLVSKICHATGNHPLLLQLVCKRTIELGSFDRAYEQVRCDHMVSYFFRVDFELLDKACQRVLTALAGEGASTSQLQHDKESVRQLLDLGLVRCTGDQTLTIVNPLFCHWLRTSSLQEVS